MGMEKGKVILAKYDRNKGVEKGVYIDCRMRSSLSSWNEGCFGWSVAREDWIIVNRMFALRELGLL